MASELPIQSIAAIATLTASLIAAAISLRQPHPYQRT